MNMSSEKKTEKDWLKKCMDYEAYA